MDDTGYEPADALTRAGGWVVDVFFILLAMIPVTMIGLPLHWQLIGVPCLYYVYSLGEYGKTAGNAWVGTLTVDERGKRLSYPRAALRWVLSCVPAAFFVAAIVFLGNQRPALSVAALTAGGVLSIWTLVGLMGPSRLAPHDCLSRTSVVFPDREAKKECRARSGRYVIVFGVVCLVLWGMLYILSFIVAADHGPRHPLPPASRGIGSG